MRINWFYVAPAAMLLFLVLVRGVGLPLLVGGLHQAGVAEMERSTGNEGRWSSPPPSAQSEPASTGGTSMWTWAMGFGGLLLVGGGVTTYFVMDRDPEDDAVPGA